MPDEQKTVAQLTEERDELRRQLERVQRATGGGEEPFKSFFENASVGMVMADLAGGFIRVNRTICEMLGYAERELLSLSFQEITHPDDLESDLDHVRRLRAREVDFFQIENRYIGKEGYIVWVSLNASAVHDSAGELLYYIGQIQDITDRKLAEQALRESEEKYRDLFDNMSDGVAIYEAVDDGRDFAIRDLNRAGEEITLAARDDVLGKRVTEVYPGVVEMGLLEVFRRVWKTGEPERHPLTAYADNRLSLWVENAVCKLPSGQIVAVFDDVTERKRMERELLRTERLRAVGELSAGVSHNLNNILTGVLVPAQMLRMATEDPGLLEFVDSIVTAGQRARDLAHRLHLSVHGVEEDRFEEVAVNASIREAVQAASPRWKDEVELKGLSIDVRTELREVPAIRGTRSRLHDLLINLLFNAVDALPEGGSVAIETSPREDHVELTIADTGIGMDEETRRRIFEPFFTTKAQVGTGLGLSTVYNTVNQWGGKIDVESGPGQGTTFTLWLPLWRNTTPTESEERRIEGTRTGKLLVVDDDEGIRHVLGRLLGNTHEVTIRRSGEKALEDFGAGMYDAVLIDLGMAGMAGDHVARAMRRIDPHAVTVLITGWELAEGDPRWNAFDFDIKKPFEDLHKIQAVVAQAIELHDQWVGAGD